MWLHSPSPEATEAAGRLLGASLTSGGAVIGLCGPLGAGKTVFVKGLAAGLGVDRAAVSSPTFVIAHEYPLEAGRGLVHVDLYRVSSEAELENAGLLDWLAPGRIVVVEWSDRLPDALPPDRLTIEMSRAPSRDSHRRLNAIASGSGAQDLVARWGAALRQAPDRCGLEIGAHAP